MFVAYNKLETGPSYLSELQKGSKQTKPYIKIFFKKNHMVLRIVCEFLEEFGVLLIW